MGTHLRVLSESYLMNINMNGFRWFLKIFVSNVLWTKVASALKGLNELCTKFAVHEFIHYIKGMILGPDKFQNRKYSFETYMSLLLEHFKRLVGKERYG